MRAVRVRFAALSAALLAGIALCGAATAAPALAATPAPLAVATTYLPPGTGDTSYSAQLAATGGIKPYAWSISAGALPTGLTLHPATGAITGKPTVTGTVIFTVAVTDAESTPVTATASESITVTVPPPTVTTTSLPEAVVGVAYSAKLAATGGITPYTWLLSGGALPAGLTLHTNGTISGTPKAGGAFGFTAEVADSDSPAETASGNLTLTVGVGPLVITTETTLPQAETGEPYSVKLTADGGIAPYTWALVSGSLPAGLALRPGGTISGTPSAAAGSYGFSVQVSDSETPPVAMTQGFSLVIPPPITYVDPTQVTANEGSTWEIPLIATGGTGSYTWSIVGGSLPAGLTFYPSGAITGTMDGPPGTYTLTFDITDPDNASGTGTLTIIILPVPQQLIVTTTSLPDADAGPFYSNALSATGGSAPYSWSLVDGSLPDGLSLGADGTISGYPQEPPGTYTFTAQVSDGFDLPGTATLSITVPTPPPLTITTTSLPDADLGAAYTVKLAGTGGVSPYIWAIVGGSLPPGLSLTTTGPGGGLINGRTTDQTDQTYTFTVQLSDAVSGTAVASASDTPMTETLTITEESAIKSG